MFLVWVGFVLSLDSCESLSVSYFLKIKSTVFIQLEKLYLNINKYIYAIFFCINDKIASRDVFKDYFSIIALKKGLILFHSGFRMELTLAKITLLGFRSSHDFKYDFKFHKWYNKTLAVFKVDNTNALAWKQEGKKHAVNNRIMFFLKITHSPSNLPMLPRVVLIFFFFIQKISI